MIAVLASANSASPSAARRSRLPRGAAHFLRHSCFRSRSRCRAVVPVPPRPLVPVPPLPSGSGSGQRRVEEHIYILSRMRQQVCRVFGRIRRRFNSCVSSGRRNPNVVLAFLAIMLFCIAFTLVFFLCVDPAAPTAEAPRSTRAAALYFGHALLPHPEKIYRGGEDAYFVNPTLQAFGVADGVGGWATQGVNPAGFSRSLMQFAERAISHEKADDRLTPVQALRASYDRVASRGLLGSCTALVARLHGRVLHVANLGDSGIIILRPTDTARLEEGESPYEAMYRQKQSGMLQAPGDGDNPYELGHQSNDSKAEAAAFQIVYRSKEQQHYFNCPFQLNSFESDVPESADVSSHELVEGDIIIAGSDGLLDNLFDNDIIKLASLSSDPQELSYILATQAQNQATRSKGEQATPFAINAFKETGFKHDGGKLDDITVIVGVFA